MRDEFNKTLPWLSLPDEVRREAMRRFTALFPEEANADPEISGAKLKDLSAHRLLNHFNMNVRKAMKYYRKEIGTTPLFETRDEWLAAYERAEKEIARQSQLPYGFVLHQIVAELMRERQ